MKVAIHQPYYLPWSGFFHKLDQADQFVFLDTAIHSKSGFFNRNKIKTPNGEKWLTVPLKTKEKPLNEMMIDNSQNWRNTHWKMIEANYKKSQYWSYYKDGFEQIYRKAWETLVPFNVAIIMHIVNILEIKTTIESESGFKKDFGHGNSRNVNIVKHLGGKIYLSGTGARVYNDEEEFKNQGIQLIYQEFKHPVYPQRWGTFLPNLSIIDMIFNYGPETMKLIREQTVDSP